MAPLSVLCLWLAAAAASAPGTPLSSFGLNPAALERLGYYDLELGLLESAANRWYQGEARERKLRELAAGRRAVTPKDGSVAPPRPPLELSGAEAAVQQALESAPDSGESLARFFDRSRNAGGAPALSQAAEAGGRASLPLAPPSPQRGTGATTTVPFSPVGGLQSRGAPQDLVRLVASRLPGSPATDLASAGAGAAWAALDRLLQGYADKARLPKPGWEQEMAEAFRDGFTRRWGSAVDVTVTDSARFFAHRGLWLGNPAVRRPDGRLEVVLNLPWMETIAQDGVFADARLARIRRSITSLAPGERARVIEEALGGRDPEAMSYGLVYRLAGWMQAELLSAAADPGSAGTLDGVHANPVWKTLYEGALNAAANLTKGLGAGLSHPELSKPDSDAELWRLVREANAGASAAAAELAKRLSARKEFVGYAEYLDWTLEHNRLAARGLLRAVPGACGLSGRLAQAGDAEGIRAFSANCLGGQGEAFLLEASARSSAKEGYREFLEQLIQYPGDRSFGERLARERAWLLELHRSEPERSAALRQALPEEARAVLDGALGAERTGAGRVLAKVSALGAATIEEASYGPARAFHAQPQSFLALLKEAAVVEPILKGAGASGVEAEFLAAVAFQEGYYLYAEALAQGRRFTEFNSMEPMGLDSFADLAGTLKRRGLLRKDFDGYRVEGERLNEANHRFRVAHFTGAEAALEAMGALIRHKRAQFESDAKALGLDLRTLSAADRELWGYVYYNYRDPKSMLSRHGLGWVRREVGPANALYNAQRVAATAALLRDLGIFR